MRYKLLGRSGLRVSELAFGAMTFGEEWGFGSDAAECRRMVGAYRDAGGNFFDTANKYTNGSSERILGEILGEERARVVVATKYTLSMHPGDPNGCGNQRKNMVQALEESLCRLGTDYVDLFWVHAWDGLTPIDEVMRGLDDLVRAGKVLYVGVSDTPAWVVAQANTLAELRGWSRFVGLQIPYSLIERTVERELLPMAAALGLAVTPWGAVGGGVLTGKYTRGDGPPQDSGRAQMNAGRLTDRNLNIAREVDAVADELGGTSSQVALRWLLDRGPQVIPIVGARTTAQLKENLAALDLALDEAQTSRLDEVSRIEPGFPHDFMATPMVRELVHGDTADELLGG